MEPLPVCSVTRINRRPEFHEYVCGNFRAILIWCMCSALYDGNPRSKPPGHFNLSIYCPRVIAFAAGDEDRYSYTSQAFCEIWLPSHRAAHTDQICWARAQ